MTASTVTMDNVTATLNYVFPAPNGEGLYSHIVPPSTPLERWTNVNLDSRNVVICNARGRENEFSLDDNGFEFLKHCSAEAEFRDEKVIKTRYYAEVEQLVKEHTGGKRVIAVSHMIRRSYNAESVDYVHVPGPAYTVHVDRTFDAAIAHARESVGDSVQCLEGRIRIINVWRPIGSVVYHEPLALADWHTISVEDDLIPLRVIYPGKDIGVFLVRYNKEHKWYYLKAQTPAEITLIKCFDSRTDGHARLSPHSAFHEVGPPDAPKRQSIEVNVLVFDQG